MRKIIIIILLGMIIGKEGWAIEPEAVLKQVDAIYSEDRVYTSIMTIYRPGKEYKKRMKVYIKGENKNLVEFLEPPKERGVKILGRDDYAWMYLPSVEKVIRLSGKTSLMGGDFIHYDIVHVQYSRDYKPVSLKEEEGMYLLELEAKTKKVAYGKIIYFITIGSFLPKRAEFYSHSNRLLKTITYEDIKKINNRLTPTKMIMQNAFSEDYKTILEIIGCRYERIPERIFTEEYLKKGL